MFFQATTDLKNYDVERHESFKQYEMQKALEEELEMQNMNDFEKKQFLEEKRQQLKKHNQHEKMPHPVSKILEPDELDRFLRTIRQKKNRLIKKKF